MSTEKFVLGPIQQAWIKSLREHPERQMKYQLGYKSPLGTEYKACCLGEGGLIAGICTWSGNGLLTVNNEDIDKVEYAALGRGAYKALGLYDEWGTPLGPDGNDLSSLTSLNDEGKLWSDIADILEQYPTAYFTHSI